MYGIIGTALVFGSIAVYFIKKLKAKDISGKAITFQNKEMSWRKHLIGGSIFGLGWALTGSCPGPMFVNIGYGYWSMLVVVFGAMAGTYLYGVLKHKLQHKIGIKRDAMIPHPGHL